MNEDFIFNLIQCVSVVVASVTAIYGITSWRRETKFKRKYELAEEVLSLFYECREKIAVIRHPASYVGEGKTRKRRENENPEETEILDNAYVFYERYDKEKEPFLKLASLKFRFIAIFGKKASMPFDQMAKILSDILFAANRLGNRYWKDQGRKNFTDKQFDKHLEEMEKYENIVWNSFENDKIEFEVDKCIEEIEKYCLLIMQK